MKVNTVISAVNVEVKEETVKKVFNELTRLVLFTAQLSDYYLRDQCTAIADEFRRKGYNISNVCKNTSDELYNWIDKIYICPQLKDAWCARLLYKVYGVKIYKRINLFNGYKLIRIIPVIP